MIDLLIQCNEPGGTRRRRVTEVKMTPAVAVPIFKKLQAWNKSLTGEEIWALYEPTRRYCTVDDVGLLWSNRKPEGLEVHFVFWDGRLRGRERLIQEMCYIIMGVEQVEFAYVDVPVDKRMILAFLRRIGFELVQRGDFFTCVFHSRRRLT